MGDAHPDIDEKNWSRLILDEQQVSGINQYLTSAQCIASNREPMLGINGLNALRETWRPYAAHDQHLWLDRVEHGLCSLGQPCNNAIAIHNQLVDDLHLAFMNSLTHLSYEIGVRN